MLEHTIENYLTETFHKPVSKDIGQSKMEKVIGYAIDYIDASSIEAGYQTLDVHMVVFYRCENGYDELGFLSRMLKAAKNTENIKKGHFTKREVVEAKEGRTMIVSKEIQLTVTLEVDLVKEPIKAIQWED